MKNFDRQSKLGQESYLKTNDLNRHELVSIITKNCSSVYVDLQDFSRIKISLMVLTPLVVIVAYVAGFVFGDLTVYGIPAILRAHQQTWWIFGSGFALESLQGAIFAIAVLGVAKRFRSNYLLNSWRLAPVCWLSITPIIWFFSFKRIFNETTIQTNLFTFFGDYVYLGLVGVFAALSTVTLTCWCIHKTWVQPGQRNRS